MIQTNPHNPINKW